MPTERTKQDGVDRRTYLAAIAAAGAGSLAGCQGTKSNSNTSGSSSANGNNANTSGSGNGKQGERVPQLKYEFTTGLGNYSEVQKNVANILSKNLKDRLGVPMKPAATEATTMWQQQIHDKRTAHLFGGGFAPNPNGLDPNFFMSLYHIRYAGSENGFNKTQYHNCKFSNFAEKQFFATSKKERKKLVQQNMEEFSKDVATITTFPVVGYSAINTDQVVADEKLIGQSGPGGYNYKFFVGMQAKGNTTPSVQISTTPLSTSVFPLLSALLYQGYWSNLVYSPLMQWDQNFNLGPALAKSHEINNGFKEIVFHLRDQKFTNGDPVTAEDVVYTYQLYNTKYTGYGAAAKRPKGSKVEAVDDKTVKFTFPKPNPVFLQSGVPANYGILNKAQWDKRLNGKFSNLSNMKLPAGEMIGSGPFTVKKFKTNTVLELEPRTDHFQTPNQGLILKAYTGTQAAYRAFKNGKVSVFGNASGSMYREIKKKDNRWARAATGFSIGSISPQMSFPPFQFREMRLAASQAFDRREANQVAVHGDSNPQLYCNYVAPSHPWWPENHKGLTKISPSAKGSKETARKTLKDAGYTWDSNGRLRYPADKDLTPAWPEGKSPMDFPKKWPCVKTIPKGY